MRGKVQHDSAVLVLLATNGK